VIKSKDPFGKSACEAEVKILGGKYSALFFAETPFNDVAIEDDTYLIIGRRGSGKTALSQYLSFQKIKPHPLYIEVSRPDVYQELLSDISRKASESRPAAVAHLKRVWEYLIWSLIAAAMGIGRSDSGAAGIGMAASGKLSNFIADAIRHLVTFFSEPDSRSVGSRLELLVEEADLDHIKRTATEVAATRPIIIAIDTLEQYDIQNDALMNALAGLIEYASDFNLEFAPADIHLKLFVAGEVFPHLQESVLLNPLKVVKHPVYLLWRPRDLLRLIGWRFYRHLSEAGLLPDSVREIRWDDDDDVLRRMWAPYFGKTITNDEGIVEDTWPYVLRHTQMRPRQVITICNNVANRALREGTFPTFTNAQVVDGVQDAALQLAGEVLNSYSSVYPNVSRIVSGSLQRLQAVFDGVELDRRAKQSAPEWRSDYSPSNFRQLVAELGVIGRVTRGDQSSEFIDADFEYALTDRLDLTHRDHCVVHPMFHRKLSIVGTRGRVIPFSSRRR